MALLSDAGIFVLREYASTGGLAGRAESSETGVIFVELRGAKGVRITGSAAKDTEVAIPARLQGLAVLEIGERAFALCKSLRQIKLPPAVTEINTGLFFACGSLEQIQLPS